jgi:hypothetical protein
MSFIKRYEMNPRSILSVLFFTVAIVSHSRSASGAPIEFTYPLVGIVGKDSNPICYMQLANGSILDLSEICVLGSKLSSPNGASYSATYMDLNPRSDDNSFRGVGQSENVVNSSTESLGSTSSGGLGSQGNPRLALP